ncbi:hypothetical protein JTB14_038250 [Gonioctena quinquepunctata]|nr:hypothetical protein JTB14_038250 [Gonioctena quinquepunctata]
MAHVNGSTSYEGANRRENQRKCDASNLESTEQVRIVIFRECMFKERQLLFDSHSSLKDEDNPKENPHTNNGNKIDTLFAKNNEDFYYLTEMIFGSTAMKYHETYYKIHNVSSPQRIVFTQVFVPRRRKSLKKSSESSFSRSKMKRSSSDLLCLNNDDSCGSFPLDLSDSSSRRDSFSIFRKADVPSRNSTSTTIDSGFSELSLASSSSLNYDGDSFSENAENFWDSTNSSLDTQGSFSSRTNSSENYQLKTNFGYSRLGLALILVVASDNDIYRSMYIQHITFVESILWRLRRYIEIAFISPGYFVSLMLDISKNSANWLLDLASDLRHWKKEYRETRDERNNGESSASRSFFGAKKMPLVEFFQSKWSLLRLPISLFSRKSKSDFDIFCELLRDVDRKETKFFLSTLLTGVLTHHVGWIKTCYSSRETTLSDSYNAIWQQISDLNGATGYLTKTSKTVIYGLKNDNLIERILEFLRYFIRYSRVQRRNIERVDIALENELVDEICDGAFGKITETSPLENSRNKSGLCKIKTIGVSLSELANLEEENGEFHSEEDSVLFILGDDEKLENLKKSVGGDSQGKYRKFHNKRLSTDETLDTVQEIDEEINKPVKMKIINLPLPKVKAISDYSDTMPVALSLGGDSLEKFVPDRIVQGTSVPESEWKPILKTDLSLSSYPSYNVEESVVILGNTNKWDVQLWSRNRSRRSHSEEYVDASELVSNILEVALQMWKLNISKQYCMTFIEQRLLEICLKASALAQFLLTTDLCTMDLLVSSLNVNSIDVPLLMSVAPKLYPEVTQKYGFSYQ